MKKNLLLIFIGFGALAVVWYAYTVFQSKNTTSSTHLFVCDSGDVMEAKFFNGGKNSTVDLVINNTERISLEQATSASGARYVNKDESFVFWNKGDSAFVSVVANGTTKNDTCATKESLQNYKTISYGIDGRKVMLGTEGTHYFGNEVRGDFDKDGKEDIAFLFTYQPGGSGTFYYVAVARNTAEGFVGTESVLLGDRVAPQTTEFRDGKIIVNYADRKLTDSFATPPSIGKSVWLILDKENHQLGEVMQNFEGEADPARMKLDMQTWKWEKTMYSDGKNILPKKAGIFTLTFASDGRVQVGTDCNRMSGTYTVSQNKITFGPMMSTKMYCEGSQETGFANMLAEVSSFLFTSKGELVLELKLDSGQMVFR